tara:strand:- start:121 stop:1095 length:975 start_codon:yes stop_codon:yes gene_type:complete
MFVTKRLLIEMIRQELKEVFGTSYGSFKRDDKKKKKDPFKFDPNSTKNQGRWRLKDPDEFERMWTRQDKNDKGISFIVGTLKSGKHGTQAVRFSKEHWEEPAAKKWWGKNKKRFTKTWTPSDWTAWKKKKLKEAKLGKGEKKLAHAEALDLSKDLIKKLGLTFWDPESVSIDTKFAKNKALPVGSIRQGKEEVGDLDIIVTKPLTKAEVSEMDLEEISDISGGAKRIDFKYTVDGKTRKVNLFIFTDPNTWGAALLHSTGPFIYNVRLRNKLKSNKWKNIEGMGDGWILSQNGIIDSEGDIVSTPTERSLQKLLRVTERTPEER